MKTMVCETIIFLGGLMACAAVCSAADSDWLNARDCGASGAKYETVATTVATTAVMARGRITDRA